MGDVDGECGEVQIKTTFMNTQSENFNGYIGFLKKVFIRLSYFFTDFRYQQALLYDIFLLENEDELCSENENEKI